MWEGTTANAPHGSNVASQIIEACTAYYSTTLHDRSANEGNDIKIPQPPLPRQGTTPELPNASTLEQLPALPFPPKLLDWKSALPMMSALIQWQVFKVQQQLTRPNSIKLQAKLTMPQAHISRVILFWEVTGEKIHGSAYISHHETKATITPNPLETWANDTRQNTIGYQGAQSDGEVATRTPKNNTSCHP